MSDVEEHDAAHIFHCSVGAARSLRAQVAAAPTKKPSGEAPAEMSAETKPVLAQFRIAGKDADKRAKVVDAAIAAGPDAVSALLAAINRDLAPDVKRYGGKFGQKAATAVRKHLGGASLKEVADLRKTVLDLQNAPDFSHETIAAKGDPAMKRLEEIFLIDPRSVLEQSKELQADREKLFGLGRCWEKCAAYLYDHTAAEAGKPKEQPTFEKYLAGEEEMCVGLAAPMDSATRNTLSTNGRLAAQLDPEEARTILALNLTRNLLGLIGVGHRREALRRRPRPLERHDGEELLRPRIAGRGQKDAVGPGETVRHLRLGREHLRRHQRRPCGQSRLVPQPRPSQEHAGQAQSRRRRPLRHAFHRNVRRLGTCQVGLPD